MSNLKSLDIYLVQRRFLRDKRILGLKFGSEAFLRDVNTLVCISDADHNNWSRSYEFALAGAISSGDLIKGELNNRIRFDSSLEPSQLIKLYMERYGGKQINGRLCSFAVYNGNQVNRHSNLTLREFGEEPIISLMNLRTA